MDGLCIRVVSLCAALNLKIVTRHQIFLIRIMHLPLQCGEARQTLLCVTHFGRGEVVYTVESGNAYRIGLQLLLRADIFVGINHEFRTEIMLLCVGGHHQQIARLLVALDACAGCC